MLRSFALAASILIAVFAVFNSSAENPKSDVDVISAYVIRHKHWSPKSFRVERADCDCAYALYRIIYLPEADKPLTPNSKSFAVYYDEQLHKIVKRTQFQ